MLRIVLPDSHCAVRFIYPDSLTGLPRLRVGIVHNFGNGYFTCYHANGEGYKSYRFDRARNLESFVIKDLTVTVQRVEAVQTSRKRK